MTEKSIREKRLEAETGTPNTAKAKIMLVCMMVATASYTIWVFI